MGVLKATIFLIGVLLVVTSVGANELGDATANPVSAYGSSDYSNLPARENLDQCSEEALSERQALQNSCLRDFFKSWS